MHRQKFSVRKPSVSPASLPSRSSCLYCNKCRQPVKRRLAVRSGRNRFCCPACGELLRPTLAESGE